MPLLSKGIIAELNVPDEFKPGREFEGGLGNGWLKSCHLNSNEAILISLFYRGTRTPAPDAAGFRRLLKTPGILIDSTTEEADADSILEADAENASAQTDGQNASERNYEHNASVQEHGQSASAKTNVQIIEQLGACLGNAYNNQIINNRNGNVGPRFHLKQLDVRQLSGRNVLSVSGYFHDYGGMPESSYMGLFVDATPTDTEYCQIQEIIFETPDEWQFKKHSPVFLHSLEGIKWASVNAEAVAPRAMASNKMLLNLFAADNAKLTKTAIIKTDM